MAKSKGQKKKPSKTLNATAVEKAKAVVETEKFQDALERIIEVEEANRKEYDDWEKEYDTPAGWMWHETGLMPQTLNSLVHRGVLKIISKSSKKTYYRLEDLDAVKHVLKEYGEVQDAMTSDIPPETATTSLPKDMFDIIIGYDDVKELLAMVLDTPEQVHIMFIGEPATAKSLFLQEIERLPGVHFAVGSRTSGPGISEVLFSRRPRILIIDEIDKLAKSSPGDLSVLLSLMEDGRVSETLHDRHKSIKVNTKVFAAGNSDKNIPPELKSRFLQALYFDKYSEDDFMDVCIGLLRKREGCSKKVAERIARVVWEQFGGDVRQARSIARLAKNDIKKVETVVATLGSYSRPPRL